MGTPAIEIFYAVAHELIGADRYRDAATVLRAMIVAAPSDDRGWLALSHCHEKLEQLVIAKEILAAGRAVVASNVRLSIALARGMRLLGDVGALRDSVLHDAELALAASQDDALVHRLAMERCAA